MLAPLTTARHRPTAGRQFDSVSGALEARKKKKNTHPNRGFFCGRCRFGASCRAGANIVTMEKYDFLSFIYIRSWGRELGSHFWRTQKRSLRFQIKLEIIGSRPRIVQLFICRAIAYLESVQRLQSKDTSVILVLKSWWPAA